MSKIRILPDQLANQIAAGEVIERPASVVKELLENSLDAGADRIEIEIEGGGTRLIRVIDNGEGMDEDDVLMSLERHGTSKIRDDRDLAAISTLGFRGEAIPSIASVSQLTVSSRQAGAALGTQAVITYGKLIKVHETGTGYGTQFEVRNLFGNTPARRKFLRTARTELGHIDEIVQNYALGAPEVTFILRIDGKEIRHLDNTRPLEDRLAHIMSHRGSFIKISDSSAGGNQRLYGYLIPPEEAVSASARLRTFVNGRAIRDRMMIHAVAEGLRSFLMKGKNPAGLIHLEIPATEVDVNVHPAKHEVRFRNSRDVHLFISQTVAGAMQARQQDLRSSIFGRHLVQETTQIPQETSDIFHAPASVPAEADRQGIPVEPAKTRYPASQPREPRPRVSTAASASRYQQPENPVPPATAEPVPDKPLSTPSPVPQRQTSIVDTDRASQTLQVIGQFDDLYILCQNSEGLIIIDQHAAHERLLFEDLRRQYCSHRISSQHLLFPETVELSLFQSQLVEKYLDELEKMGFSLRHFGGNAYVISAIPSLAGQCRAGELLLDMLEQFGNEQGETARENRFDHILATMACRAAVKAGARLSDKEIEALLERMARADLFSHCPHGRPVWKNISRAEMKKWFHRT